MNLDVCSIIVAILALSVSVYNIYAQRKHNMKNIFPICDINEKYHEDNIAVLIVNKGLGVMTIDKISVRKGNHMKDNLIEFMPHLNQKWKGFSLEIEGKTITPNNEIVLCAIKPENDNIRQQIKEALKDIEIVVNYKDVYGNEFEKTKILEYGKMFTPNFPYKAE